MRILLSSWLIFVLLVSANAQTQLEIDEPSIRYVIAFSDIEKHDKEMRSITLLIKPESFTQSILAKLIDRIGNRFPRPRLTYFNIYTNLDDIKTPEEHDDAGMSETPEVAATEKARVRREEAICVRLKNGSYGTCYMVFANGKKQEIAMGGPQSAAVK